MPRAATSVATSVLTRPDSKRASAFSRCDCDLSPCIATAWTFCLASRLTSRSAPRFVRTKTSVSPRCGSPSSCTSADTFASWATRWKRCSTVPIRSGAGVCSRRTASVV